jgi:hypothetical protein
VFNGVIHVVTGGKVVLWHPALKKLDKKENELSVITLELLKEKLVHFDPNTLHRRYIRESGMQIEDPKKKEEGHVFLFSDTLILSFCQKSNKEVYFEEIPLFLAFASESDKGVYGITS